MESNQRYYFRRAVQETMAAARAMTPDAREWHRQLAEDYTRRAQGQHAVAEAA